MQTGIISRLSKLPTWYPLLFALFPIFNIYIQSPSPDFLSNVWRLFLFILIYVSGLILVFYIITRNTDQAAFSTTLLVFVTLYFGQESKIPDSINIYQQNILIQVIVMILVFAIIGVSLTRWFGRFINPIRLRLFLNLCSLLWIITPVVSLSGYLISFYGDPYNTLKPPFQPYMATKDENKPDIYYIILDGYGRNDVLEKYYRYNNSSFLKSLQDLGFYVADQSHSNYHRTQFSIASSLNSEYLDYLQDAPFSINGYYELNLFKENRLSTFLKAEDYTLVGFDTGFQHTSSLPEDIQYAASKTSFNGFETTFLNNTTFGYLRDIRRRQLQQAKTRSIPYDELRKKIRFEFSTLGEIAKNPEPTFTFAHILSPHPPFVFAKDGSPIYPNIRFYIGDGENYQGPREEYLSLYPGQLEYVNSLVLKTVKTILAESTSPPIIIVQGDHGPGAYLSFADIDQTCLLERTSILNAYLVPENMEQQLYPSITPVNSFRIVLNGLFGTGLGILDDRIYFSNRKTEHHFLDVTDRSDSPCLLPSD